MTRDSKGITQFYLQPTHKPYLPLLPSLRALCLPTEGWPGWVDLGDWLYTEIDFPAPELNPDTVTHPSTNQARRRLTSLIETNALTTIRQTVNLSQRANIRKTRCLPSQQPCKRLHIHNYKAVGPRTYISAKAKQTSIPWTVRLGWLENVKCPFTPTFSAGYFDLLSFWYVIRVH